jgi:hypothetical protein
MGSLVELLIQGLVRVLILVVLRVLLFPVALVLCTPFILLRATWLSLRKRETFGYATRDGYDDLWTLWSADWTSYRSSGGR